MAHLICCKCKRVLGEIETAKDSHGYCLGCYKIIMRELDAMKGDTMRKKRSAQGQVRYISWNGLSVEVTFTADAGGGRDETTCCDEWESTDIEVDYES